MSAASWPTSGHLRAAASRLCHQQLRPSPVQHQLPFASVCACHGPALSNLLHLPGRSTKVATCRQCSLLAPELEPGRVACRAAHASLYLPPNPPASFRPTHSTGARRPLPWCSRCSTANCGPARCRSCSARHGRTSRPLRRPAVAHEPAQARSVTPRLRSRSCLAAAPARAEHRPPGCAHTGLRGASLNVRMPTSVRSIAAPHLLIVATNESNSSPTLPLQSSHPTAAAMGSSSCPAPPLFYSAPRLS